MNKQLLKGQTIEIKLSEYLSITDELKILKAENEKLRESNELMKAENDHYSTLKMEYDIVSDKLTQFEYCNFIRKKYVELFNQSKIKLDESKKEVDELKKEVESMKDRLEQLQEENDRKSKTINTFNSVYDTLNVTIAECHLLKKEVEELNVNSYNATNQIRTLTHDIQALEIRLSESDMIKVDLKTQNTVYKTENYRLKTNIGKLLKVQKNLFHANQKKSIDLDIRANTIKTLTDQLKMYKDAHMIIKNQINTIQ